MKPFAYAKLILVAEDQEDEAILIRRAFEKAGVINPIHIVRNGEDVLAYLKGEGPYSNRDEYPLPQLLLLDLKMPKMDGFEVLQWVRQQPGLAALRIVVLTCSQDIRDVNKAYKLGANSFLVKPVDFKNFAELANSLQGYWLWLNVDPEISRPPKNHSGKKP